MLTQTRDFINSKKLFTFSHKLLVGVSGGADSLCLLDLLHKLGYSVEVAHCNFQLRDQEADKEQAFVQSFCEEREIECHTINFQTQEYAAEKGISIEMAARDLRYEWFYKLCEKRSLDYIAIAHNQNDVIETFFINLNRGAGLKGLRGIQVKNCRVVRPILFASREQIELYCKKNSLDFKIDSSNLKNDYLRNKFRNIIIPEFVKLNPNFQQQLVDNIGHLDEAFSIYQERVEEVKALVCTENEEILEIDINSLVAYKAYKTYLFEIVKAYGFRSAQVDEIIKISHSESGKIVESQTHKILKDRNNLLIYPIQNSELEVKIDSSYQNDLGMEISDFLIDDDFRFSREAEICQLDFDKVSFPLSVSYWQTADYFYPLGMKNRVKLKDFFINNKISVAQKSKIKIIKDSTGNIIWVAGYRMDNRYKITQTTNKVLQIKI